MKGVDIEKHFSIKSSVNVKEICDSVLSSIGITYFNYIKVYHNDCSRELLTNNPEWIKHFYKEGLYHSVGAIDVEHLLPKGYFLWSELNEKDPVYLEGRDYFNIDNGISFVIKRPSVTYLYIFASSQENYKINNFYSGNIDLLKRFIHYFTDRGQDLIKTAADNRIYLPEKQIINMERVNNNDFTQEQKNIFLEKTEVNRYFILNESDDLYLTKKQAESAKYFSEGFTSKQIARKMDISFRTVENYLYEVKDKIKFVLGRDIDKKQFIKIIRQSNLV